MDDTVIQDLKQFISGTVSQEVQEVRSDLEATKKDIRKDIKNLDKDIKNLDKKLTYKIDDLSLSAGTIIDQINVLNDGTLNNHNVRIKRLEKKVFIHQ